MSVGMLALITLGVAAAAVWKVARHPGRWLLLLVLFGAVFVLWYGATGQGWE